MSISELATADRIDRGYLGRVLQLTLLAPALVEALLDGRGPEGVGLPRLMEPFPNEWAEQRAVLGDPAVTANVRSSARSSSSEGHAGW